MDLAKFLAETVTCRDCPARKGCPTVSNCYEYYVEWLKCTKNKKKAKKLFWKHIADDARSSRRGLETVKEGVEFSNLIKRFL